MNYKDCWYKSKCSRLDTDLCSDVCIQYYEMLHLLKYSGLPENMFKPLELIPENCDFGAFTELANIKANINQSVKDGLTLYIYSANNGNGKTSWAVKLLQSYFNTVVYGNGLKPRGFFIHTPSFIIDKKMTFKNDDYGENRLISVKDDLGNELITMNNLLNVDLIVWDEIGVKGMSQFDYLNWLSLIDQRMLRGKANIFTGNLDREELLSTMGNKLVSRIYDSSIVIEFKGNDRRRGGSNSVGSRIPDIK